MSTGEVGITMSMREADCLKIVQMVVDRMSSVSKAAERLGITTRQVERLLVRYRVDGLAIGAEERTKERHFRSPAAHLASEIVHGLKSPRST